MKQKRTFLILGSLLIVIFLILIAWIYFSFQKRLEITENIYCQQIAPGMSLPEVRSIFSEYGDFEESMSTFKSGIVDVIFHFIDPAVNEKFGNGRIVVVFVDGKLKDVRVPVPLQDSYRSLCQ